MGGPDAVVIGAGPNGLAAAITLARAGRSVVVYEAAATAGGGCRSAELTEPGFVHDVCAAVHPFGVASPFFASAPLEQFGLQWLHPEVPLVHPLDHGRAVGAFRSLDQTAEAFGDRARTYRRAIGSTVEHFAELSDAVLAPLGPRSLRHPVTFARFGLPALAPATVLAKRLGPEAGPLFAGCAAHSFLALERPLTSSFGLVLLAAAHAVGWPVARGGSQAITDAMVAYLVSLGGEVRYNHPVRTLSDMAPARVVLADTAPGALGAIATDRLGGAFQRRAERFTHGPGVFKIDYALDEPVPWTNELCHRAGTLHLGGTVAELAASERDLTGNNTRQPPFVLVAQPSVCDESRAPVGKHTLWVYCHVPAGSTEDMTSAVEAQIERFAPGFGDVVRARHTMNTAALAAYNANYVGGDIAGGSMRGRQVLMRGVGLRPYRTGVDSVLLCSASTPPGAGIHGMCGMHAANTALAGVLR